MELFLILLMFLVLVRGLVVASTSCSTKCCKFPCNSHNIPDTLILSCAFTPSEAAGCIGGTFPITYLGPQWLDNGGFTIGSCASGGGGIGGSMICNGDGTVSVALGCNPGGAFPGTIATGTLTPSSYSPFSVSGSLTYSVFGLCAPDTPTITVSITAP